MKYVQLEAGEVAAFFDKMGRAAKGELRKEMETWLEGLGVELLRIVQEEIIRLKVVDTRLMLNSFHKGSDGNVWEIVEGGLTLEVGSTVEYAGYVNDGHWTNPKGVERRFVPGYWQGDRFIYDRNADGGMMLSQKWVEGKHYFDSALRILEKMFPKLIEAKLEEWFETYF